MSTGSLASLRIFLVIALSLLATSKLRVFEHFGVESASDALKLRVLRAFRPRVRFERSKTTYFTTFSTDRPIASALRAFEDAKKQSILRAFRSTDRSTESLDQSKHAKTMCFTSF